MLSRFFILKVDNRNYCYGTTYGDLRRAISRLPEDDVDSMQIERVYDVDTLASPVDETELFARHWSTILTPADPVPAFVRHHCPELRIEFAA